MSSDSDDDVPLAQRRPAANGASAAPARAPAAARPAAKPASAAARPAAARPAARPKVTAKRPAASADDGDDGDESGSESGSESDAGSDVPLSQRQRARAGSQRGAATEGTRPKRARTGEAGKPKSGQKMWSTLKHSGVLFPPEYEAHGVKMLYDGRPVELTPEQEEVAGMFAIMKETDYMSKPMFLKNFWEGFKEVLGPQHVIQSLEKCDFTPMYEHYMADREAKKNLSKEEKLRIKEQRDLAEAKYKVATVDGRVEQVGNFRVEPPGLFRGRGEHPRMGKIKRRVYPRDITINIGTGEPIPEHPYPGQTWKEVRHDQTVTWLAYWKDTLSEKDYKYVFLAATSAFKADSDLAKYEKARKLKGLIGDIRRNYEQDWSSQDQKKRQMAVAMYFLDKLALRAGHEKDEDEADTVGCCTLKCENVEMVPPNHIKFDFLGKDSIKYENTVEVHAKVYANIEKFKKVDQYGKKKEPGDQLFDAFDATALNKELKMIMDGLSVKVFRTYNASITLDRLLREQETQGLNEGASVDARKANYDKANKEVAILCNHQRSIPKAHTNQMDKLQVVLTTMNEELAELEADLRLALRRQQKDGKLLDPDAVKKKIERKKDAIAKKELQASVKEDLKTVALGTSKINYMDPRITIAWCKRNEVPLEKVFNKSLLAKFNWSMEVEPEFQF